MHIYGKQSWDGYVQHCTSEFATAFPSGRQAVLTVQQNCDIDYQFCVSHDLTRDPALWQLPPARLLTDPHKRFELFLVYLL